MVMIMKTMKLITILLTLIVTSEYIASSTGKLGEDVEWVEADWEIPLAGGVPGGCGVFMLGLE